MCLFSAHLTLKHRYVVRVSSVQSMYLIFWCVITSLRLLHLHQNQVNIIFQSTAILRSSRNEYQKTSMWISANFHPWFFCTHWVSSLLTIKHWGNGVENSQPSSQQNNFTTCDWLTQIFVQFYAGKIPQQGSNVYFSKHKRQS